MIHIAAGSIPVVSDIFQAILNTIGWVLARIYDVIPSYGISIIVLTLIVRLLLLPLGIKQISSMHNMQTLQPKIKAVQNKYKGNRQKAQEEVMKLYKETGVNPLSGCWPVLLQFPILIAMYAVLRPPIVSAQSNHPGQTVSYTNNHLPGPPPAMFSEPSTLFHNVTNHIDTNFLGMNLQCPAIKAGTGEVAQTDSDGNPVKDGVKEPGGATVPQSIDCGTGIPVRVPYYLFLAAMVATTFYQQRQMQNAAPPGAQNSQQQALFKLMPLMFGVFGIAFPSGLVLYWVTSNAWQIGQQSVMLRLGHIGPNAKDRPVKASKPGLLARLQDRASAEGDRREQPPKGKGTSSSGKSRPSSGKGGKSPNGGSSSKRPSGSSRGPQKGKGGGRPSGSGKGTPKRGPKRPPGGGPGETPPSGGSGGADDGA